MSPWTGRFKNMAHAFRFADDVIYGQAHLEPYRREDGEYVWVVAYSDPRLEDRARQHSKRPRRYPNPAPDLGFFGTEDQEGGLWIMTFQSSSAPSVESQTYHSVIEELDFGGPFRLWRQDPWFGALRRAGRTEAESAWGVRPPRDFSSLEDAKRAGEVPRAKYRAARGRTKGGARWTELRPSFAEQIRLFNPSGYFASGKPQQIELPGAEGFSPLLVEIRPKVGKSRPRLLIPAEAADPLFAAVEEAKEEWISGEDAIIEEAPELAEVPTPLPEAKPDPEDLSGRELGDVRAFSLGAIPGSSRQFLGLQLPTPIKVYRPGTKPGQCPQAAAAHYWIVAAGALHASHTRFFEKDPAYPEGVQERDYQRDKNEQTKVIEQGQCLEPAYLVNTNPDAVNGPPIAVRVEKQGANNDLLVVGGNSRVITLQRVLTDPEPGNKAEAYLVAILAFVERLGFEYLPDELVPWWNPDREGRSTAGKGITVKYQGPGFGAKQFGTETGPFVLVRVLDQTIPEEQLGEELGPLRELVREYNESLTQTVSPASLWVSLSNKLGPETLATITTLFPPDQTFNAYLSSSGSRQLVDELRRVGIINRRNASTYLGKSGLLNEDGKAFLARILIGKAVADPVLISELPLSLRASLAGAVPFILRSGIDGGPSWDLLPSLDAALRALLFMRQSGAKTSGEFFAQYDLDQQIPETPMVVALLDILLARSGKTQLQQGFRKYASAAASPGAEVPDMFGVQLSPVQILRQSFNL